jgi:hypothetical protein
MAVDEVEHAAHHRNAAFAAAIGRAGRGLGGQAASDQGGREDLSPISWQ